MFWVRSEADLTKPDHILRHVMAGAGHFYLTKLLLPLLTATATKAPAKTVRVVNVSSVGHYLGAPEGIRWTTIVPGTESREARKKLGSTRLFGQSKTVGSMSSLPIRPVFNLPKGKYPLLKRACPTIRQRRHRVHLPPSRHKHRSPCRFIFTSRRTALQICSVLCYLLRRPFFRYGREQGPD
jgi:hypothetical protein